MKYKVGDKVKIHGVTDHRSSYNGKEVTIISLNPNGSGGFEKKPHYGVGEVYIFFENELAPVKTANNKKIVITTDGTETLARLYEGDKVVKKATAKCSPDDTFDFNVGAKLAFERLMNEAKNTLTFREKLKQEHPEYVNKKAYWGGCKGHPYTYGYEPKDYCPMRDGKVNNCIDCWDRVIPEDKAKKKEEDPPKYYNGKVVCVGLNGCNLSTYTVGKIYQFVDGQMTCDNGSKMPCYKHIKNFEEWDNFSSSDFVEIVE